MLRLLLSLSFPISSTAKSSSLLSLLFSSLLLLSLSSLLLSLSLLLLSSSSDFRSLSSSSSHNADVLPEGKTNLDRLIIGECGSSLLLPSFSVSLPAKLLLELCNDIASSDFVKRGAPKSMSTEDQSGSSTSTTGAGLGEITRGFFLLRAAEGAGGVEEARARFPCAATARSA